MVQKIHKKLTADQKKRGVIYSSTLSNQRFETTADTTHEVFRTEPDREMAEHISRLRDDRFFNGYKKYNIIRS